jgi:asparagine synthase (glutamine-hydrolysing)
VCGICGVVDFDGAPVAAAVLREMTDTVAHRGPDAEGFVFLPRDGEEGPVKVGLGHRRLAIIDLSPSGAQPMTNEDGTLWVVLNGEIYNFRELRAELEARGHPFKSQSDTEVILHLYEERGEACVEALDGMFAFALWDGRRHRLLLARDRAGKKPLFYAATDHCFVFGSEVKAVLRHPAVAAIPAVEAFPHYFVFGYPPPGETFHRGVRQLPPAHWMTVDGDGAIVCRRYWDLTVRGTAASGPSEGEAVEAVRTLVTEAVRKRLVTDVPLGAFLSGGMDSSVVVALMSRLLGEPVKTFSLGFAGDPAFDETPYARQVAAHYATHHTEFVVEPDAVALVERLVRLHDGPFGDSSAIPTFLVSELTRRHVTVALTGDGGDEVFAGYPRFQASVAAEVVPRPVAWLGAQASRLLPEPRGYHHPLRRAQRFFAAASLPLLPRLREWNSVFGVDLRRLLHRDLWAAAGHLDFPADVVARARGGSVLAQILYVNFMTYLPGDLLVKADRTSMGNGLETRSPFLDRALVEYVAGLPDRFKLRGGTVKWSLKRAFADVLPRAIVDRPKRGFGVPLGAWFRGELRDYVRDLLTAASARSRAYVDPAYVRQLVDEHARARHDHGHKLWALLVFEVWLRQAGTTA